MDRFLRKLVLGLILVFGFTGVSPAATITNGDFSNSVPLYGYSTTGDKIWGATGNFAQLETDGSYQRTLEQTFTIPSLPTLLSFDFAFSTNGTSDDIPGGVFPDSFGVSLMTTIDGDFLDILVVDVYGPLPDPFGVLNISYNPNVTIPGFQQYATGTSFSGRISLFLPNDVLGEGANIYFDLFDEEDTFSTIAAVDNLSAEISTTPIPEPSTILLLGSGMVSLIWLGRRKFFLDKMI